MSKTVATYVLTAVTLVLLFMLAGLIVMGVWNAGLVPLIAACGGSVSTIGFWTGVFVYAALMIIKQPVPGGST